MIIHRQIQLQGGSATVFTKKRIPVDWTAQKFLPRQLPVNAFGKQSACGLLLFRQTAHGAVQQRHSQYGVDALHALNLSQFILQGFERG